MNPQWMNSYASSCARLGYTDLGSLWYTKPHSHAHFICVGLHVLFLNCGTLPFFYYNYQYDRDYYGPRAHGSFLASST